MSINELGELLATLREIIHDSADNSMNDSYYFYVYYSYLLLEELELLPKIRCGVGRCWIEIEIRNGLYIVDLNWEEPLQGKDKTYLSGIEGQEVGLDEFIGEWGEDMEAIEVKRWPKLVQPHKVYKPPLPMSKNPTTPKRPPTHVPKAPIMRPNKRI